MGRNYQHPPHANTGRTDATVRKLQSSSGGSNILGWFVYRAGMNHGASMRESRVCQQLFELRRATNMPVLFGVVSSCADHGGATTTFQLRVYQQQASDTAALVHRAVHMRVDNIGTSISANAYDDVSHLCVIPQVPSYHTHKTAKDRGDSTSSVASSDAGSRLHQLAVDGVYGQVQGIEELYKNILRKVDSLSREVCQGSAELCQQLQRVATLEGNVHSAQTRLRVTSTGEGRGE